MVDGGTLTRRGAKSSASNSGQVPLDKEAWRSGSAASNQQPQLHSQFESFEGDVEDNESIFTDILSPFGSCRRADFGLHVTRAIGCHQQ